MISDESIGRGALNRDVIAELIGRNPPLVADYLKLERQLQPNGFDLTVRSLSSIGGASGSSRLGVANLDRRLPEARELPPDDGGWWRTGAGDSYLITFNEVVNLPRWLMALGRPRSSLLRMNVTIHTGVWDAGYSGRSQAVMAVHAANGFELQRNARVVQLVFFPLAQPDSQGYAGRYQHENL